MPVTEGLALTTLIVAAVIIAALTSVVFVVLRGLIHAWRNRSGK